MSGLWLPDGPDFGQCWLWIKQLVAFAINDYCYVSSLALFDKLGPNQSDYGSIQARIEASKLAQLSWGAKKSRHCWRCLLSLRADYMQVYSISAQACSVIGHLAVSACYPNYGFQKQLGSVPSRRLLFLSGLLFLRCPTWTRVYSGFQACPHDVPSWATIGL